MNTPPRRYSALGVLLASVILPPAGLVLLWLRHGPGVAWKIFASAGILGLTVVYLVLFFGLRVVPAGNGFPTIVTFSRPEAQADALERHRARQGATADQASPGKSPIVAEQRGDETSQIPRAAVAPAARPRGSAYWTDFRGPQRDGVYDQTPILMHWPEKGLPLVWKQPIGGGYSSFAIARGRAFTIEQRRDREVVAAYDLRTGRELWTDSWVARFHELMGGDGPRATPTWHDGRVYALGATGVFRCLDEATGKVLWSRNILEDARAANLDWGMAASPLVVDDKVIVLPGGDDGRSVAAYSRLTGEVVWTAQNESQAYASPMLVSLAGRRQLLVVSSKKIMGLRVEDGSKLWEFPWVTQYDSNSAQPVLIDGSHFVVSSGYGHGAALIEIFEREGRFDARAVWQNTSMKTRFNSPVVHGGHLYGLDEGILVCVDARTGERRWKGGRYGYGQVLLAAGRLIITTEDGDIVLVKAVPDRHEELSRFAALSGKTWNYPAMADGYLLVRNETEMAAYKIAP